MKTKLRLALLPLLALPSLATACGGGETSAAVPSSDVPESFHLAAAPAGARPVSDVVASAKDGDSVVVTGRVGGAEKVFVDGYAAFTIVDAKIPPCGEGKMDECKTPWDYCCDSPDELAKNALSVELVADGKPLAARPRGFHGLDHLKTVTVAGEVDRDAAGNVRVLASGVHVAQ